MIVMPFALAALCVLLLCSLSSICTAATGCSELAVIMAAERPRRLLCRLEILSSLLWAPRAPPPELVPTPRASHLSCCCLSLSGLAQDCFVTMWVFLA